MGSIKDQENERQKLGEGWRKTMRKEYARKGLEWYIKEKYQKGGWKRRIRIKDRGEVLERRIGGEGLGRRMEEKNQEGCWRKIIRKEVGGDELARRLDEMNQEGGWMR